MSVQVQGFFHDATYTISYLVWDPRTRKAALIDPALDYDPATGSLGSDFADKILAEAAKRQLEIGWILETHVHADHLTAAHHVRAKTGAKTVIGSHVTKVQDHFAGVFNASDVSGSGAEFDTLLADGDTLSLGTLTIRAMHTPGHTPACATYIIDGTAFVGDTLFMPDYGTARCDFPGGDARTLYQSIRKILELPPQTRLFMCHDYKAPGRDTYAWETTVAEERASNIHVKDGISETEFVEMREKRDASLAAPTLLLPSLQVNMRAGRLPDAEANGSRYLKIPLRINPSLSV